MSGVLKIEIKESLKTLKDLLLQQKTGKTKERILILYWLKSQQASTVEELAALSGHHRTTISRWLSKYRSGGISALLNISKSTGRQRIIPPEIETCLVEELKDPEGFASYEEVQTWLRAVWGIEMSYTGVHKLVRYRLKAKLKVPRPSHIKQKEGAVDAFKKNLGQLVNELLKPQEEPRGEYSEVRYWCQDESRIGLMTIGGKKLTLKGVQPVGVEQWQFEYIWLYGLVEPKSGESFFYEFCHLDSICFEKYLELFAKNYPESFHVIQLDNGGLHQAKDLAIPENIVLLFQPPYSPQVNPIERLWRELKKEFRWKLFDNLEELRIRLSKEIERLTPELIRSVTGWQFILDALSVANI